MHMLQSDGPTDRIPRGNGAAIGRWRATMGRALDRIEAAACREDGDRRRSVAALCGEAITMLAGRPCGDAGFMADQVLIWFRMVPPDQARTLCEAALAKAARHARIEAGRADQASGSAS